MGLRSFTLVLPPISIAGMLNELAQYPESTYLGKWTDKKPVNEQSILMIENKKEMMHTMESMMGTNALFHLYHGFPRLLDWIDHHNSHH